MSSGNIPRQSLSVYSVMLIVAAILMFVACILMSVELMRFGWPWESTGLPSAMLPSISTHWSQYA